MFRALKSRRRLYAIVAIAVLLFARGAVAAHACSAVSQSGAGAHVLVAPQPQATASAHHGCEQVEDTVESSAICHASCLHDVQATDPAKLPVAAADAPALLAVAPAAAPAPVSRFVRERFLLAGRAEPPPLVRNCSLLL
jgi:hypothetical protein